MKSPVLPLLSVFVALGACLDQEIQTQLSATTHGFPVQTTGATSPADQVQREFSQTMDTVNANMAAGMNSLVKPFISFEVETVPNLVHLYCLIQGCPVSREFINMGKDMWGQGAVKMAQLMGRGTVAGSNLAKGAMQWSGNALNGMNGFVNNAAETGIDVAYKMVDATMNLEMKKLELLSDALKAVGKALQDAGPSMKAMAGNVQAAMKGVEGKVNESIANAQQTMAKVIGDGVRIMEDGSRRFQTEAQSYFFNLLTKYIEALEKVRENLKATSNKIAVIENASVNLSHNGGHTDTGINDGLVAALGSASESNFKNHLNTGALSSAVDTATAVGGLNLEVQVPETVTV